eukprot:scaffold59014_cov60-Phaeocystis_antarctica.AAC.1
MEASHSTVPSTVKFDPRPALAAGSSSSTATAASTAAVLPPPLNSAARPASQARCIMARYLPSRARECWPAPAWTTIHHGTSAAGMACFRFMVVLRSRSGSASAAAAAAAAVASVAAAAATTATAAAAPSARAPGAPA